jgi:hypothetical protein
MRGVQPKTTEEIASGFAVYQAQMRHHGVPFPRDSTKWVPFEDYKSVVDRLGLFYREVLSIDLDPPYVLPSELTERAVARIRTEFYRRFSEFFSVEKIPSHSPPQENREFGSWRNNKSQCGKRLEESGC